MTTTSTINPCLKVGVPRQVDLSDVHSRGKVMKYLYSSYPSPVNLEYLPQSNPPVVPEYTVEYTFSHQLTQNRTLQNKFIQLLNINPHPFSMKQSQSSCP